MTDQEQIDRLETRVDKIEHDVYQKLDIILAKLTAIEVAAAATKCPAPGACLDLAKRVDRLESTHDNMAKTVADLIRWRAWLTGINLVISTLSLAAITIIGSHLIKSL